MSLADFGLAYDQRQRAAATQRDAQLAQNAYSRFLSQQRGTRNLADLNRGMTEGLGKFGASFGRRGLRNSGIFARAQNDYASSWAQQAANVNDQTAQQLNQLNFADQSANANYQSLAAEMEAQKQAQIMATAAQLNDFRNYLGG